MIDTCFQNNNLKANFNNQHTCEKKNTYYLDSKLIQLLLFVCFEIVFCLHLLKFITHQQQNICTEFIINIFFFCINVLTCYNATSITAL